MTGGRECGPSEFRPDGRPLRRPWLCGRIPPGVLRGGGAAAREQIAGAFALVVVMLVYWQLGR